MSYCRFSSMNFMCDVYVYESCSGGWITHVAELRRKISPIPEIPQRWLSQIGGELRDGSSKVEYPNRWLAVCAKIQFSIVLFWNRWAHQTSLRLIPLRPIGLPHDGETFNDATPGECATRLENLRLIGYVVPKFAIDALCEEEKSI